MKAHCLFSRANCGGQHKELNGQVYNLTCMKYYKAIGLAKNNKALLPLPPKALFFMIINGVFEKGAVHHIISLKLGIFSRSAGPRTLGLGQIIFWKIFEKELGLQKIPSSPWLGQKNPTSSETFRREE